MGSDSEDFKKEDFKKQLALFTDIARNTIRIGQLDEDVRKLEEKVVTYQKEAHARFEVSQQTLEEMSATINSHSESVDRRLEGCEDKYSNIKDILKELLKNRFSFKKFSCGTYFIINKFLDLPKQGIGGVFCFLAVFLVGAFFVGAFTLEWHYMEMLIGLIPTILGGASDVIK